jgi:D-glycero-alpha-D-manno-heptose-7-phosphate kinase
MIITRTPFRVSFFGGGSDMAAFYRRSTGAVLSTSIDRYMYLSAHPYFDGSSISLKYSRTELAKSAEELQHPIVKTVLMRQGLHHGVEITSTADVPSGTGLGSSSSFTVGLLHLIYAYQGKHVSHETLARTACDIEIEDLGAPIGKQDQYAAAYGGLNFIQFFSDDKVDVTPLVITPACRTALESSLMMFYTGEQRSANDVLAKQRTAVLTEDDKFKSVQRMVELAWEARRYLENEDVSAFGRLLHVAWDIKRSLSAGISNAGIDDMYTRAMEAGAWGGKLLGAGGGGFLLLSAPRDKQPDIRRALHTSKEIKLGLDRGGSKVVYTSEDF